MSEAEIEEQIGIAAYSTLCPIANAETLKNYVNVSTTDIIDGPLTGEPRGGGGLLAIPGTYFVNQQSYIHAQKIEQTNMTDWTPLNLSTELDDATAWLSVFPIGSSNVTNDKVIFQIDSTAKVIEVRSNSLDAKILNIIVFMGSAQIDMGANRILTMNHFNYLNASTTLQYPNASALLSCGNFLFFGNQFVTSPTSSLGNDLVVPFTIKVQSGNVTVAPRTSSQPSNFTAVAFHHDGYCMQVDGAVRRNDSPSVSASETLSRSIIIVLVFAAIGIVIGAGVFGYFKWKRAYANPAGAVPPENESSGQDLPSQEGNI